MWLGIVCTCLPILYTFYRTFIARKKAKQQGAFVAVHDPNSGRAVPHDLEDSGYYTGNSTVVSSGAIDLGRLSSRSSDNHELRAAASNKNLLVSAERCED
jgi:hypothetical protein